MNCSNCQQPYENGDSFCGRCGTRLIDQEQSDQSFIPLPGGGARKPRTRRKKTRRRGIFKILGSVFLVLVLLVSISGWYVISSFDGAQSLSEVPEAVSLSLDEGEEGGESVNIDTGPALAALNKPPDQPRQWSIPDSPFHNTVAAQSIATPDATSSQNTTSESSGITVLLMGVDAGSSEQIDVGVRPDSLSVLHLDPNDGTCRLLGIPRDSRVDLPGYGLTKINHALAIGGIPYQQLVVEQFLGIEINHYGLVDFEGLVGVVDAVGGIIVNNPYAFDHMGIHFAEGEIHLDGESALIYSRYRYGPDGDFGRIDRQQLVIRALLSELGGMDAVRAVPSLLGAAEGHFKTDLSVVDLVRIANDYRTSCTASTLETQSMTGAIEAHADPIFNADLSYVNISEQDLEAAVRWLLTGENDLVPEN